MVILAIVFRVDRLAKVVQLVGSSDKSFSDAVRVAVSQASQTIRGITGVDVVSSQASVHSRPAAKRSSRSHQSS